MRRTIVGAVLVLAGCSDSSDTDMPPTVEPSSACAAGEWLGDDDRCHAAGLPPDLPCPPGEVETNGSCRPAGTTACAMGFEADDDGCTPILPEMCPPGTMALMGETRCREVAPCPSATWGDAPVAGDTQFVDQNYPGTDSDG